jgi:hypothetical protein
VGPRSNESSDDDELDDDEELDEDEDFFFDLQESCCILTCLTFFLVDGFWLNI